MLADYRETGLSVGTHPLALLRPHLPAGTLSSPELHEARHGATVAFAGMAIARQRPATAKGIVFMLLEDEHGQVNLIVPKDVYERHRGDRPRASRSSSSAAASSASSGTATSSSASSRACRRSPGASPRPRTSSPLSRARTTSATAESGLPSGRDPGEALGLLADEPERAAEVTT